MPETIDELIQRTLGAMRGLLNLPGQANYLVGQERTLFDALNTSGDGNGNNADNAQPSFEDLFQEQLKQLLGPDPGATFRNVFADIFQGFADTPLEQYIQSQFGALQDAYITVARAGAEHGEQLPTFEQFLSYLRPQIEKKFQFTREGAADAFDQLLKFTGNVDTPYSQFVQTNFDRIFRDFNRSADTAERSGQTPQTFLDYLSGQAPQLRSQYEYTRPGALESFSNIQRLREGANVAQSPFENFVADNFDRLFNEFQLGGTDVQNRTPSFGNFIGENKDRLMREFYNLSPRARGQRSQGELASINRIQ